MGKGEGASTAEEDVKLALRYMKGVTSEALKLHFKREELPGLNKRIVEERRKREEKKNY